MTSNAFSIKTFASWKPLAFVVACLTATFAMPSGEAHATSTEIRDCVSTGEMIFAPKLSTALVTGGSIEYDYTAHCVIVYTNGATGVHTFSGYAEYDYSGSCVTASVVNPTDTTTVGLIVGGTSLTRARVGGLAGVTWAGEYALVSHNGNPCDMTKATVISAGAPAITPGSIP